MTISTQVCNQISVTPVGFPDYYFCWSTLKTIPKTFPLISTLSR